VAVHYAGWHLFPFFALGTMLLAGALVGRLFCGWVCPFGFLQDMLYRQPTRKFSLPRWTRAVKYVVLATTVVLLPFVFGEQTLWSFCRACPASAIQVTIPNIAAGGVAALTSGAAVKLSILAAVLLLVITSSRAFCAVFCPIGAFLAPLNHLSAWRVKAPSGSCISCGKCDRACPTAVEPSKRIAEGIPANRAADCIVCHECRKGCPKGAETGV
jgi:polyferredoxin